MKIGLETPLVQVLRTTKAHLAKLSQMGITRVYDLLMYLPRALEATDVKTSLDQIEKGVKQTIVGEIGIIQTIKTRTGKRIYQTKVNMEGGGSLAVIWFRMPYAARNITPGTPVTLIGKIKADYGKTQLMNPESTNKPP